MGIPQQVNFIPLQMRTPYTFSAASCKPSRAYGTIIVSSKNQGPVPDWNALSTTCSLSGYCLHGQTLAKPAAGKHWHCASWTSGTLTGPWHRQCQTWGEHGGSCGKERPAPLGPQKDNPKYKTIISGCTGNCIP